MIVHVPPDAAVECWAVGRDGQRLASSAGGELDVPTGGFLEVRGRRRSRVRLAWLAGTGVPVVSVDVRRGEVGEDDLVAVASLPDLALLTAAGDELGVRTVTALGSAGRLAVLQLAAPALRPGDLEPLRGAERLRQVRLEVPGVPAGEVLDVLAGRRLGVFGLSAPRLTAAQLDRVGSTWPLRELAVTVDRVDFAALRGVSRLASLTTLGLDGEAVSVESADVASLVIALPRLVSLDITAGGRPVPPGPLLGAWWIRPGLRINGLAMDAGATARFVARWPSSRR